MDIRDYISNNSKPLKFLLILAIVFFVIFGAIVIYVYEAVSYGLPSLEQLENPKQNLATQVFSSDGDLLDHYYIERRVSLPIDSIPRDFINGLIAVEDRKFYSHWGVHTERIVKAAIKDILSFHAKEGASTLTMQLARNLYFNQENTMSRKLKEALTAIQIERTFTKSEILEMYCNTVLFGRGAFGIQVASQVYFDKQPIELTTGECAFLVGLLKNPEHYNGLMDYDRALQRRNLVLKLMREQDYLTEDKYQKALDEPINLARGKLIRRGTSLKAPHFVEMIRQQFRKDNMLKDYDLYRDGLLVYTTLNSSIQKYAREAIDEHMAEFQKTFNKGWSWSKNQKLLEDLIQKAIKNRPDYSVASPERRSEIERMLRRNSRFIDSVKNAATTVQVGLVVIDPSTGDILAMVGASPKFMAENPDSKYSLNHAVQIKRQPGSSFKPFVYASALQDGLNPHSLVDCGPYTYTLPTGESWSPHGSGDCEPGGQVTLYEGLSRSINTVAARLITQYTSPNKVTELAHRMGIESSLRAVPALALGAGGEVSPLEMTSAMGTFANEGIHVPAAAVNRIEDQFGNILYEKKKVSNISDAISPKIAHEIISMMRGVVDHGTGYEVRNFLKGVEAAGKTGTTNDFADAWFVGYTPQLVCGLWVGFDDRRVTFTGGYGYAGKAAAPIWGRLMAKIYNDAHLPYKQKQFSFSRADSIGDSLRLPPEHFDDMNPANNNVRAIQQVGSTDKQLDKAAPITNNPKAKKDSSRKPMATPTKLPNLPNPQGDKKKTR